MANRVINKLSGKVDVVPSFTIEGQGCSTSVLIKKAEEIVNRATIMYEHIWLVFDKDDFDDFDEAIKLGEQKGYKIAWSNQCFEYWIYLHFHYSDSDLHRDAWNNKLDKLFKDNKLADGKYKKNYENIFEILESFNGSEAAIKHGKQRMSNYSLKCMPSEYSPGTTVHILVEELKSYLK